MGKIMRAMLKRLILRTLSRFNLYPNIFFTFAPFKIYEFKELLKNVTFSKGETILDIGCGSGMQTMLLAKKCKKIIGIDINGEGISAAKKRAKYFRKAAIVEFRCTKIEGVFQDEYFDKIFSICVLEHIPNYEEVLKEAYRILKKGGRMIFSVDSLETIEDPFLIEKHRSEHHVVEYFQKERLKAILEKIGFREIEISPICKSDFAKKRFSEGIDNEFREEYLSAILGYFILANEEKRFAHRSKGIFLIVKCCK